tara:strand:- start:337 stop:525 length:189 start_codon:yes stop_codon:yes gene_type:complete
MKYLTILNFTTGTVHQYKLDYQFRLDLKLTGSFEDFINDEGFELSSVQWMVHDTPGIIHENQ